MYGIKGGCEENRVSRSSSVYYKKIRNMSGAAARTGGLKNW